MITLQLSGDVLSKYPDYGGEYRHNGEYSWGIGVYTNSNTLFYQFGGWWCIGDYLGDTGKIRSKYQVGGGAPNCPTMVSKWEYLKSELWTGTTDVKISCNTDHQK